MKSIWFTITVVLLLCSITSCEKDDDSADSGSSSMEIVGTWELTRTTGETSVIGVSQEDEDNEPTGTITFRSDGTGSGLFNTELFGVTLGNIGDFTWSRSGDITTITEDSGEVNVWKDVRLDNSDYEAEWTKDASGIGSIDIVVFLKK